MQFHHRLVCFARELGNATLALLCVGCDQVPSNEPVTLGSAPVVYGTDNRGELSESTHPVARLLEGALVALMPKTRLHELASGETELRTATLGVTEGLCPGERFAEQPSAAQCSGTFASNGLILTANHCVTSLEHCQSLSWVFGYAYRRDHELTAFAKQDIYECQRVVAAGYNREQGVDYAWVELDRPVVGRRPIGIPTLSAPLTNGSALLAAGFGQGIPAKLDPDVRVLASHESYFTAAFESFNGSSGMPVLTPDGTWVGFALRGEADYESTGGCRRAKTLGANCEGCVFGGEQVANLSVAIDGLRAVQTLPLEDAASQVESVALPASAAERVRAIDAGVAQDSALPEDGATRDTEENVRESPSAPLSTCSECVVATTDRSDSETASCAMVGIGSSCWHAQFAWSWELAVAALLVILRLKIRCE